MAARKLPVYELWEILDRRVVVKYADGISFEWWLVVDGDHDAWHPYVVAADGITIMEAPVWAPLPGSQYQFLQCPVQEALLAGNRGPGKTMALLMDFAREVGKGYGSKWRGILFRRHFGDLDDVVRKIEDTFPTIFGPGFRFLKSKSEYAAVWETGETLLLRHLADASEYEEYHGHEYPWMGFEELTQWPTDDAFTLMLSCNRPTGPGIPCRVRATTNPSGPGHRWVKKRYNLPHGFGKIIRNPGEIPRVAINSHLKENFILLHSSPNYADTIRQAAKSPAKIEAWLNGSWDITSGGMFDDLWEPPIHIVPNFGSKRIPRGWTVTRSYDHGQSHPFANLWWLESNGESITVEGRQIGGVRGDLILFQEWYGAKGDNEGIRMSATNIAGGILEREDDMGLRGRVSPGPADNQIWTKDARGTQRAPIDDMEEKGLHWVRADQSPGSIKRGLELIRESIEGSIPEKDGTRTRPGIFVCGRCAHWIDLVPTAPRDTDDPDALPKGYEDHLADATRYRLTFVLPGMWRRSF